MSTLTSTKFLFIGIPKVILKLIYDLLLVNILIVYVVNKSVCPQSEKFLMRRGVMCRSLGSHAFTGLSLSFGSLFYALMS